MCLPTPTEEADGNGYGAIAGRGGPSRPPPRASVNLVLPLLLTGVSLHPPAPKGGPTSTSADVSVPRPRTHDDRTGRVFPDHLITCARGKRGRTQSRLTSEQLSRARFRLTGMRQFRAGRPHERTTPDNGSFRNGAHKVEGVQLQGFGSSHTCRHSWQRRTESGVRLTYLL
jgi:hypothetical protein